MNNAQMRVDGVVFQLLGSYCGQSNPSPAKKRFANDERKLSWRYLLSNQYTRWNKFIIPSHCLPNKCIVLHLAKALSALLFSNTRNFKRRDIQWNRIHYKGDEYIEIIVFQCCGCGFHTFD